MFVMNLVVVEVTLLVLVMGCDRFLAVRFQHKYASLVSPTRIGFIIGATWAQSLAFSVPLSLDITTLAFQPYLHSCSVSNEIRLSFVVVECVLCFLAPALATLVLLLLMFRARLKQRPQVKSLVANYTNTFNEEQVLGEVGSVRLVVAMFLLWVVLDAPYIVATYIQQFNANSKVSFSVSYTWSIDASLLWMRFAFPAFVPCMVLVWRKDVWQSCKDCVMCHRSNSILDIQAKADEPKPAAKKEANSLSKAKAASTVSKNKDQREAKHEPPSWLSFNVPVLFATSDGIHIETPCYDESDVDDSDGGTHVLKGRKLDVGDSIISGKSLPCDTSDYDSTAEDAYFTSPPISARHVRGVLDTPSARMEQSKLACDNSVATQGADSGVDLTTGSLKDSRGWRETNDRKEKTSETENNEQHTTDKKDRSDKESMSDSDKNMKRNNGVIKNKIELKNDKIKSSILEIKNDKFRTSNESSSTNERTSSEKTNEHKQSNEVTTLAQGKSVKDKVHVNVVSAQNSDVNDVCNPASADANDCDGEEEDNGGFTHNSVAKSEKSVICDKPHIGTTTSEVHSTPKIQGRLQPLTHQEARNKQKKDVAKKTKKGNKEINKQGSSAPSKVDSHEKKHKRTVTADSEKALLGSNSSAEMQTVKASQPAEQT
jgi:hypothetical protein